MKTLLIYFIIVYPIFAQFIENTSELFSDEVADSESFLVLNIGNKWIYKETFETLWDEYEKELTRTILDTITVKDKKYYIYNDSSLWESYVDNKLYRYDPALNEEYMYMDFNHSDGDTIPRQSPDGDQAIIIYSEYIVLDGLVRTKMGYHFLEGRSNEYWISGIGYGGFVKQELGSPKGTRTSKLMEWSVNGSTTSADYPVASFLTLSQNYPNPFNPETKITYSIVSDSDVNLTVYDVLGNKVSTLIDDFREAGLHYVVFDASHLPSGVYIYQLKAGGFSESKKMILLK